MTNVERQLCRERRAATEERRRDIEAAGYRVKSKWSCNFKRDFAKDKRVRQLLEDAAPFVSCLPLKATEDEIHTAIATGRMQGFVMCDAYVPEQLRECFSDLPPIIRKGVFGLTDLTGPMRTYATRCNLMPGRSTRTNLVSCFEARQQCMSCSYAQMLIRLGVEISNITEV